MSLISDLFSMLDKRELGGIAETMGESGQSVTRGMQSAIGTVLGGVAIKSDSPGFLRKILDMVPSETGNAGWSNFSRVVSDPTSPLMSTGGRVLSTLFGESEEAVTRALGVVTGLKPGLTSSLLTVAAPMVISFLGRRVREEGMSMGALGALLQREMPAIRAALPAGVTDLLWPRQHETATASPVVAQAVTRERSPARWLVPLLVVLIPGLLWLFTHGSRRVVQAPPPAFGTANRAAPEAPRTNIPESSLPANMNLYFETGSAKLRPESDARLTEFAAALATKRDARVMVSGYTDNRGGAASNMRLSQERANAVKADLERKGIAADRVTVQSYGEENPIADNATAAGRGMNRRVSVGAGD